MMVKRGVASAIWPNQRAAIAADFGVANFTANGLRRCPRCHGNAGISAALAAITDFSQRRSFFIALILHL
jgi:cytochrome c553